MVVGRGIFWVGRGCEWSYTLDSGHGWGWVGGSLVLE